MLVVAKANVRHRHPKGESEKKKTGLKACPSLQLSYSTVVAGGL